MTCKVPGCPEPEHAPGPWRKGEEGFSLCADWEGEQVQLASMSPTQWTYPDDGKNQRLRTENRANFCMIAASPARTHALAKLVAELRASYHDEGELLGDVVVALGEAD